MEGLGITYCRENQHTGITNLWGFPVLLVAMNKSSKNASIGAGWSCDGRLKSSVSSKRRWNHSFSLNFLWYKRIEYYFFCLQTRTLTFGFVFFPISHENTLVVLGVTEKLESLLCVGEHSGVAFIPKKAACSRIPLWTGVNWEIWVTSVTQMWGGLLALIIKNKCLVWRSGFLDSPCT